MHLLANYQAVRSVRMESLNRPRLLYTLDKWTTSASVPGIDETNLTEPLLTGAAFIPGNHFSVVIVFVIGNISSYGRTNQF